MYHDIDHQSYYPMSFLSWGKRIVSCFLQSNPETTLLKSYLNDSPSDLGPDYVRVTVRFRYNTHAYEAYYIITKSYGINSHTITNFSTTCPDAKIESGHVPLQKIHTIRKKRKKRFMPECPTKV